MEVRKADDLQNAEHPYTRGLMSCLPQVGDRGRELAVLTRDAAWLDYQDGSSD
jgi:peptide/nickel transport system ATP-binding protein